MHSLTKTFFYYVLIASVALAMNVTGAHTSEDGGNIVFNQMLKCLKLPANAPSAYSFLIVAVIKDGSADFLSVNFRTPPSEWEKTAAPSIADAITQCEPYSSISGRMEFAVTRELIEAGSKN
ncbi:MULTISPECIES: hypothetical protein [Rhizobium]|uniref:hypothetical protein n=1 Tax=Rhizobium TaxID=379 RepID=UPI000522EBAB|nr:MULTISPECIES: hypothetical protein [Rhizobium]KPN26124.1 hypothetical protein KS05_13620 [Rhizobium brockwellii]QJX04066.1 hypothetical protein RLCC275e_03465 [Rhizobium brockwellii]TAV88375.1 hypothetical protein ELI22_03595 [Rhizobium leguminosarum]TAV92958.1 hypothetical protein ELI21_03600 [Rhizobium leguminosarum]TAW34029.1 hypothetical protein ELI23_03600 [Rhizobium leguminosarum]